MLNRQMALELLEVVSKIGILVQDSDRTADETIYDDVETKALKLVIVKYHNSVKALNRYDLNQYFIAKTVYDAVEYYKEGTGSIFINDTEHKKYINIFGKFIAVVLRGDLRIPKGIEHVIVRVIRNQVVTSDDITELDNLLSSKGNTQKKSYSDNIEESINKFMEVEELPTPKKFETKAVMSDCIGPDPITLPKPVLSTMSSGDRFNIFKITESNVKFDSIITKKIGNTVATYRLESTEELLPEGVLDALEAITENADTDFIIAAVKFVKANLTNKKVAKYHEKLKDIAFSVLSV